MSESMSSSIVHSASRFCGRATTAVALAAVLLFASSPPATALDWEIERVDDAINWIGSGVDIVVGDDGTPHIGHGTHPSQIMRYAVKQGDAWLIEEVDHYPTGPGARIALDPDGNPCLAYIDWDMVAFARRVGGVWQPETVARGQAGPLVFAEDGTPHIMYCNSDDPWNLKHAWKTGGTWETEDADLTVASGYGVDVLLDGAGQLHVAHWAAPNYGDGPFETRYSWWDGSAWQNDVVDSHGENCNVFRRGLVLDSAGDPHIAYSLHNCWGSCPIKYAVREEGTWTFGTVDSNVNSSADCCLVLDASGAPHVVYGTGYSMSGGSSELRYAYLDGGGNWVVEVIDADGDAGELNSLALDSQGYLHVAYFRGRGEGQDGEVRYARSTTPVGACAGDVDGDGDTDLSDLAALLSAYGSVPGDPNWNPACDFDGDDDVDLTDLAYLLSDYGCGG